MGRADPARVAALFDALVDKDPASADRELEAECLGETTLRDTVRELLDHDRAQPAGFLRPSAGTLLSALGGERARLERALEDHAEDDEAPPSRIGRFHVLRRLGMGAMGVVYVGYDEALDRRVALKLLRGATTASAWLLREGQALGRITHPNVVTIYEVGQHEGRVYLAMELVDGPTLRTWLRAEPRSFRDILRVLMGAAEGLVAVHEAGLLHRDFKPDNVLIGKDGRPQVADFGIAALSPPEAADLLPETMRAATGQPLEASLVQRGALVGTPAYMAPEQLRGERGSVWSDQWSFAVTLYRAVYGAPPFPTEDDLGSFSRRVIEGSPLPPPRRDDLPAWLEPIVLRALARDPRERFASMRALLGAIDAQLPRDPELDPTVVKVEVRILRLAVLAVGVGLACVLTATDLLPITTGTLVLVSCVVIGLELAVIRARWASLAKNRFGRRTAWLIVGASLATLLHRLLALELGMPPNHVLVTDLLLLALVYGFAAVTVERWIGWLAAATTLASAVGALAPALVLPAFILGTLGTFMVLTADAFRRR